MTRLFFKTALLPKGWAKNVCLEINRAGWISTIHCDHDGKQVDFRGGIGIPGVPNCHSHVFQGAVAGLSETNRLGQNGFWSWREFIYDFAMKISPDDLAIIGAQFYIAMLEAGFTAVAEFHYLHNAPCGNPYDDPAEMSSAVIEAAAQVGIGITLLPVFYGNGDFAGAPISKTQERFFSTPNTYEKLVGRVREIISNTQNAAFGIAPHSLRAVTPDSLNEILILAEKEPIHIHAAEQVKEVEDCLAWSGMRPVEWLLENTSIDHRWCVIHATHMTEDENRRLAGSGAMVGLCPITEANLGDGTFGAVTFINNGGQIAVGTDSNINITATGELCQLEYSQRMDDQSRNRISFSEKSTGRSLFDLVTSTGALANGMQIGRLAPGFRGDIISLNDRHPQMLARSGDAFLDSWIFSAGNQAITDVWVAGNHLVKEGRHYLNEAVYSRYRKVISKLLMQ